MNRLQAKAAMVAGSAGRMLAVIDLDPASPTRGCAHLDHWRDKTSEFADARRQEIMLPLALLYTNDYPGSVWKSDKRLLGVIESLLDFWTKSQYPDGSFDEWYKGERAYAACAFTGHAVARTLLAVGDELNADARARARRALARTAAWLTRRQDLFKANHQAVGVAALAYAAKALGDQRLLGAAKTKLNALLASQNSEGWFPEVGHMDPGYTFLTAEFIAMYIDLSGDASALGPIVTAFDFACEFVHPDLSLGDEYGVCHNPYVSAVAAMLLSPVSRRAAGIRAALEGPSLPSDPPDPMLQDDLRLARWAFQALLAHDLSLTVPAPAVEDPLPLSDGAADERVFPLAGLIRLNVSGRSLLLAPCAGGLIRFFGDSGRALADAGYAVQIPGGFAATPTYDRELPVERLDRGFAMTANIVPVKKFMPSFLSRLVLRLVCTTLTGSRLARKGIDLIRERKGNAVNQASASVKGRSRWTLTRAVFAKDDVVVVRDRLDFGAPMETGRLFGLVRDGREPMRLEPLVRLVPGLPERTGILTIVKKYAPGLEWRLLEVRQDP